MSNTFDCDLQPLDIKIKTITQKSNNLFKVIASALCFSLISPLYYSASGDVIYADNLIELLITMMEWFSIHYPIPIWIMPVKCGMYISND